MKRTKLFLLANLAALALLCHASATPTPAGTGPQRLHVAQADAPKLFHGVGKVTAVDAPSGFITLKHEAIPGLMDAMEMQFEAKPATILDGLKVGDKVEFTINGKTWALLAIGKIPAER